MNKLEIPVTESFGTRQHDLSSITNVNDASDLVIDAVLREAELRDWTVRQVLDDLRETCPDLDQKASWFD